MVLAGVRKAFGERRRALILEDIDRLNAGDISLHASSSRAVDTGFPVQHYLELGCCTCLVSLEMTWISPNFSRILDFRLRGVDAIMAISDASNRFSDACAQVRCENKGGPEMRPINNLLIVFILDGRH